MNVQTLSSEIFDMTGYIFSQKDYGRLGFIIKKYGDNAVREGLLLMKGTDKKQYKKHPIDFLQSILSRKLNKTEVINLLEDWS